MVKAPCHFPGDFHMRHLVLPHRHKVCLVDKNIRCHQQRISQKAVSGEIFAPRLYIANLQLLLFISGHALQPAEGHDHRQQQV